ncbi:conserved hypothetical protein [Stigmatella aurantiaca DW4/3-1]|uniref:Uncharacterized protein n=1 Tax=Stigmatella aurantiaca (strain DW4/3-1) TaxID=378806 RepID=Q097G2_STIAD|nr:conserved hypothetical protein [Stigmatella aurantiaca DW4/3-1]
MGAWRRSGRLRVEEGHAVGVEDMIAIGLDAHGGGRARRGGQVAGAPDGEPAQVGDGEVHVGIAAQPLDDLDAAVQGALSGLGQCELLGAEAERHAAALLRALELRGRGDGLSIRQGQGVALLGGLQEGHLRRAEESGDKAVDGVMVELLGRAPLLDVAPVEEDHLVGQGHGLDLVVGDVDHRRLELLVQAGDLQTHLRAQGGIQVGERLVEQEDARLADDGAANGDALPLATGERGGFAVEQRLQFQDARGAPHLLLDDAGLDLGQIQREGHVLPDGHVGIERVGLEHHRQVAPGRGQVRDGLAIEEDLTRGGLFQAGDQPQQRGLATARGAQEDAELVILDAQIHAFDDAGVSEGFGQGTDVECCHERTPKNYLTAPKVRPRTSCFCEPHPITMMGAQARVETAESLAQKRPSGLEKEATSALRGAAWVVVRFSDQNASFQLRMRASSAVEASPPRLTGSRTR